MAVTKVDAGERIVFLDHLRGLACFIVVMGHVYLMGINDSRTVSVWLPFVTEPIFGADSPGRNPFSALTTWLVLEAGISVGPLGVAIFFLVSGFVILRSIDRDRPFSFLVKRCFRIFPLSAVVAVGIAVTTAILCWRYGGTDPHSVSSVIATSFAMPGIVGTFSTIPVIWSLTVEVFFYLLLAFVSVFTPKIQFGHIIMMSILSGIFFLVTQNAGAMALVPPAYYGAVTTIGFCAFHIGFMLIGSLLYRAQSLGNPSGTVLWVAIGCVVFGSTLATTLWLGKMGPTGTSAQNCIAAFIIFVAAMMIGSRSRLLLPLKFLGDISYPLYLLHIPIAWMLMFVFARRSIEMNIATSGAIIVCIGLAWLLHKWVEIPSQQAGKLVANRLTGREPVPSAL